MSFQLRRNERTGSIALSGIFTLPFLPFCSPSRMLANLFGRDWNFTPVHCHTTGLAIDARLSHLRCGVGGGLGGGELTGGVAMIYR